MEKSKNGIKIAFIFLYEFFKLIFALTFTSVFLLFAGIFLSSLYIRNFLVKKWREYKGT